MEDKTLIKKEVVSGGVHSITAAVSIMTGTTEELNTSNVLPEGLIFFNKETKELKISDGVTPLNSTPDHLHPNTHAPLVHSHIFGTNEPWLMSNPKLWLRADLKNHPELIPLDGQHLAEDDAAIMSEVYPGSTVITDPILRVDDGYTNDDLKLTADEIASGSTLGNMFTVNLAVDELININSQWLVNSAELSTPHSLTIEYTNGASYRPSVYAIVPASSVTGAIGATRPSPKAWKLEGVPQGSEGDAWEVIDTQSNITTGWEIWNYRLFNVTSSKSYTKFKITVTEWNAGVSGATPGLRRFIIYGRKNGQFHMPYLEAPSEEFAYVVPKGEFNTGLKHEDVGDVGATAIGIPLPKYRVAADGSARSKSDYPELFSTLRYRHDHEATHTPTACSGGKLSGDQWTSYTATESTIDYTMPSGSLGKYKLDITGYRVPTSWSIEGSEGGDAFEPIQNIHLPDASHFPEDKTFMVDTTVTDKAFTTVRLKLQTWDTSGDEPIGIKQCVLYNHPKDQFYVPTVPSTDAITYYVVSRNAADDTSADVIQSLQQNVVDLAKKVSELQNQVNKLDPEIIQPEDTSDE